jgi:hypothetical protein
MGAVAKDRIARNWFMKMSRLERSRRRSLLTEVPVDCLVHIANFVASGGLCDEKDVRKGAKGVVGRLMQLGLLRSTSKRINEITADAGREALAFVMRLAPLQTLSTEMFIILMRKNPDLAQSLLLQNESAEASSACTQSEAVTLSRLVELSRASARARAAIAAADKFQADDHSEKAVAARASDAEKMLEIAASVIDSARPALRASLARATVGTGPMYPNVDVVLDAVIARLKGGEYKKIEDGKLKQTITAFLQDAIEGKGETMERFGPMCLWDVSDVRDFKYACSVNINGVHINFNSDLFWETGSAEEMDSMFFSNANFKGYVGTWDVSRVEYMGGMFSNAAIEDSGIANWNTRRVTDASHMFFRARSLSESLSLSGWVFGPEPDLDSMFGNSSIVDCGIGDWNVDDADVSGMLFGADRFTGNLHKWPTQKVRDAHAPALPPGIQGGAAFGSAAFERADTERRIAAVFATALRSGEKGAQGVSNSKEQCAIL